MPQVKKKKEEYKATIHSRPSLKTKGPSELSVVKLQRLAAKIAENAAASSVTGQAQRLSSSIDKLSVKNSLRQPPKVPPGSHLNASKVLDNTLSSLSNYNQTDANVFARTAIKSPVFQKETQQIPPGTSLILNNTSNQMSRSLAHINQTVGTTRSSQDLAGKVTGISPTKGQVKASGLPVASPAKRAKTKAAGPPATPPSAAPPIPQAQSNATSPKAPVKKSTTVKSPPPTKTAAPPQKIPLKSSGAVPANMTSLSSQLAGWSINKLPDSIPRVQEVMQRKDINEIQRAEELKRIIRDFAAKKGIPLPGGIT